MDHFAVHVGPGIRTCLYMKGCPLHCMWCHSPQSQRMETEILFTTNRCVHCGRCVGACPVGCQIVTEDGERRYDRAKCRQCGKCVSLCPAGALFVEGREMTVEAAAGELLRDRVFYRNSGGGVTISGDLLELAEYADEFYYDYKLADEELFEYYTGGKLRVVSENLGALRKKTDRIVLRIPMIPGITDTEENVDEIYRIAAALQIEQIHLLPYNESAGAKYEWCGRAYELEGISGNLRQVELLKDRAPAGTQVVIMK